LYTTVSTAPSTAPSSAPVVIQALITTVSSETALTAEQQTNSRDAYCALCAKTLGLSDEQLVCAIALKTANRRRLLALEYILSAWVDDAEVLAAVETVDLVAFATAVSTDVSTATGETLVATVTPDAPVTAPLAPTAAPTWTASPVGSGPKLGSFDLSFSSRIISINEMYEAGCQALGIFFISSEVSCSAD
jgi:hypothetical protein